MITLITQGSQGVAIIRELFALGRTPAELLIFTTKEEKNVVFIEFCSYYQLDFVVVNKSNINTEIFNYNYPKELLISYSNPFIISNNVLKKYKYSINFHPGNLPQYRGLLPVVHAMLNDDSYIYGCWHYMNEKIDAGNIIRRIRCKNLTTDTAFSLHHKVYNKSTFVLSEVLDLVYSGYEGRKINVNNGNYYRDFPILNDVQEKLREKISFFPPQFK